MAKNTLKWVTLDPYFEGLGHLCPELTCIFQEPDKKGSKKMAKNPLFVTFLDPLFIQIPSKSH